MEKERYSLQKSGYGYKLLYEDGVFCEFAVFDEVESMNAAFAPGRIVWKEKGVGDALRRPNVPLKDQRLRPQNG